MCTIAYASTPDQNNLAQNLTAGRAEVTRLAVSIIAGKEENQPFCFTLFTLDQAEGSRKKK